MGHSDNFSHVKVNDHDNTKKVGHIFCSVLLRECLFFLLSTQACLAVLETHTGDDDPLGIGETIDDILLDLYDAPMKTVFDNSFDGDV